MCEICLSCIRDLFLDAANDDDDDDDDDADDHGGIHGHTTEATNKTQLLCRTGTREASRKDTTRNRKLKRSKPL